MIGKLKGIVDSCGADHAIVDVNGVGYFIYCSANTLHNLTVNQPCKLFIITHVREDHIHLYGFSLLLEKEYFTLLQSVTGIGSRMALAILSSLSPDQISAAIMQKDKDIFKSVSGVGVKLAERILIELRDKIKGNLIGSGASLESSVQDNRVLQDGIDALISLGVQKQQAYSIIHNIVRKHPGIKTDELIRLALKERS